MLDPSYMCDITCVYLPIGICDPWHFWTENTHFVMMNSEGKCG